MPRGQLYLYHLCHVALGACVVSLVLHPHQHDEVQVVPHVVLVFDVLLKGHGLVVKLVPLQPWGRQGRVEEDREEIARGEGEAGANTWKEMQPSASPPKGGVQVLLVISWHLAHKHPNQGAPTQLGVQQTSV